jgi:hypothetical protein
MMFTPTGNFTRNAIGFRGLGNFFTDLFSVMQCPSNMIPSIAYDEWLSLNSKDRANSCMVPTVSGPAGPRSWQGTYAQGNWWNAWNFDLNTFLGKPAPANAPTANCLPIIESASDSGCDINVAGLAIAGVAGFLLMKHL